MIDVLVNGVGTIGKRVAEAVDRQEDMNLYGVSDVSASIGLRTALSEEGDLEDADLYASTPEGRSRLREDGLEVEGILEENLEEVDVVVDATPSGVDEKNKEKLYEPNGVKAVFQGGAPDDIAEVKFNASTNYEEAIGEDYLKVVSCNTTSLSRTMSCLEEGFGIEQAVANLVRRGGDVPQDSRGPINSTIPVTDVPSHHGPDVQAVMPDLDITTLAVKVPVTYGHVHMVQAELEEDVGRQEVLDAFGDRPRIRLLDAGEGFDSTAKVHEKMRDLGRKRSDMHETGIWRQTVTVENGTVHWIHMVHQEAIAVPDTVDAVRAVQGIEKQESLEKTNSALGTGK
jgi:glyceraldehyde-3-phosphate dehydrogenase (NAD(P))